MVQETKSRIVSQSPHLEVSGKPKSRRISVQLSEPESDKSGETRKAPGQTHTDTCVETWKSTVKGLEMGMGYSSKVISAGSAQRELSALEP